MHAGPPGGGGEGLHHSGTAQDGDTAQHSQPGVGGLLGDFLPVRNRHPGHESGVGVQPGTAGGIADRLGHHPARHAGDGRLPHLDAGSRAVHGTHSGAAGNSEAIPFRVEGDGDADFRAVGGVRVVAAILDDRTEDLPVVQPFAAVDLKCRVLSDGETDGHLRNGEGGISRSAEQR